MDLAINAQNKEAYVDILLPFVLISDSEYIYYSYNRYYKKKL